MSGDRGSPAFYALRPGGWRDLVTLLHPPYTAWHLSYVVLGATIAPVVHPWRLVATVAGFLLGLGVGAHALDELQGRPLGTRLSRLTLWLLAAGGLGGAVALGVVGCLTVSVTILPFIVVGLGGAAAYNLELLGGRVHNGAAFALMWGAFPVLTGYWAQALALRPAALVVASACAVFSVAQRHLSAPARDLRRRTVGVEGRLWRESGPAVPLTRAALAEPLERALAALALAMVTLAVGLLLARM